MDSDDDEEDLELKEIEKTTQAVNQQLEEVKDMTVIREIKLWKAFFAFVSCPVVFLQECS